MPFFRRPYALIVLYLLLAPDISAAQFDQDVRVKLFDLAEPTAVSVTGREGPVQLFAGDFTDEIATIDAGESATLSRANGQLHVKVRDVGLFARDIRIEPSPGGQIVLSVVEGKSETPPRSYQGGVTATVNESEDALHLINEVTLEDYVAAVVSVEYGFDDLEGAKAMAVIIRTYTLATLNKYGADFDHVDHTLSQVYRGTEQISPTIRQAVEETSGEVLTYDNELIEAVYFAVSGGHTADNESVWDSEALPYLRGKPDPYGASAPQSSWTVRLSRDRLLSALSTRYGSITGFVVGERSGDGRVATVQLLKPSGRRQTMSANEFRMAVIEEFGAASLRSTLFEARREGDQYVFEGKGYGHGVGLSQWGAREMALRDASYREILDFYYTDVRLASLDDVDDVYARRADSPQLTLHGPAYGTDAAMDDPFDDRLDEQFDDRSDEHVTRRGDETAVYSSPRRERETLAGDARETSSGDERENSAGDARETSAGDQRENSAGDDKESEQEDLAPPPVRRIGW